MTQILVIEDDVVVCTPMLKLLRAEAFDVLIANDGSTGVQLAQIYEPDLIICDIMMPEFDGYEVLQALRQHPATAAIPFIFLSAKADHMDLRQGMELGADDYLTKPVKRAELLAAIAARLSKRAALTQPYIDEMKRVAKTLGQMAYVDPLTNLPNRISFHAQCQKAIRQAQQAQQLVAVLRFNLKDVEAIDTTLGGAFNSDRLLQEVAERLKQAAANYPVARLTANDFGMLLDDVTSEQTIVDITKRVLATLAEPYQIDGQNVQVLLRVGVAFYPDHGSSPGELFTRAEIALHDAAHGNHYQLYTPAMAALAAEHQIMQSQLGLAISRCELQIQYQPQVNLITGRMIGAEALLLWNHPDRGVINPYALIAVADDEIVCAINQWTLETACKQAKDWQATAPLPIRLAVHLFARQFQKENVVATVAHILQQTELDPAVLMLELTETCAMEAVDAAILKLEALKAIGVQIAIDEFGTGFSSLNYLKRFPLSLLKIDPSLIQRMLTDANDAAIVKTIIAIGQSLQLKVMAEGVETAAQVNFLRQSGCYAIQGAWFGAPLPASDLQTLLLTDQRFEVNSIG